MSRSRTDQDSPWKLIIEQYFPDFMSFFFPQVYALINWQEPCTFLDKELQKIVRDAKLGKRYADKLIKVHLINGEPILLLVHIEIQAGKEADFERRMYCYYYRISDRYNLPVSSFAILCDTDPNWRPTRYQQQTPGTRLNFEFSSIKLLDYQDQWQELEANHNPFATVVMAQLKTQATRRHKQERKDWKFRLIRRLYERGYQQQDILSLFHFLDWLMILPESLDALFWKEMQAFEQERQMPYVTSIERIGIQKGLKQGLEQGSRQEAVRLLTLILRQRFVDLPEEVETRLQQLGVEQLESLALGSLTVDSLEDLMAQIPDRTP
jgi:Domain of unknown function (DUF4351)